MPKIKTHKESKRIKKRYRETEENQGFRNHINKENSKRKRGLRQPGFVHESMEKKCTITPV